MREAAFSSDEQQRLQHVGAVRLCEAILSGAMMARYAYQAREKLDPQAKIEDAEPTTGTPWMESDT